MSVAPNATVELCEEAVGGTFDDTLLTGERIKIDPGGNGFHRREIWRCDGVNGTYFVKMFEPTDTGWEPEAVFFDDYAPELDCVVPGQTFRGLQSDIYANALVTRGVAGPTMDTLIAATNSPAEHRRLSRIGGEAMRRLHAIPLSRFGNLAIDGPKFADWKEYINAMLAVNDHYLGLFAQSGLTEAQFSAIKDIIACSSDDTVTAVLCHGDPKPVHVIQSDDGRGVLYDFGRAQAKIPLRDCLQYSGKDSVYFEESELLDCIAPGLATPLTAMRAEVLIKMSGLLIYCARSNDPHARLMAAAMGDALIDNSLINLSHYGSIENYLTKI